MARSKTPKWPHDHAAKHAQAARKGWTARRKASGKPEPSHYLKERQKTAPKKATPAKVAPDTFELIGVQKANGKWVVMRRYKSGKVTAHSEKEYSSNPFGKRSSKPKNTRGQSALFGGDYETGQKRFFE